MSQLTLYNPPIWSPEAIEWLMTVRPDYVRMKGSETYSEGTIPLFDAFKILRPVKVRVDAPMMYPRAILSLISPNLRSLTINEAYYSSSEWHDILGRVPQDVEELRLIYSRIVDPVPLTALLKRAKRLRVLDLCQTIVTPCGTTSKHIHELMRAIGNLQELEYLVIQSMCYTDMLELHTRNESLRRLKKLQYLDISRWYDYPPLPFEKVFVRILSELPNLKTCACISIDERDELANKSRSDPLGEID